MKLNKQIAAVLLAVLITVLDLSGISHCFTYEAHAVTFEEVNTPELFLKQVNGDKQCTLVAATMLIRRAAMLSGNQNWADITVDKVKEQAWVDGVGIRYTFTYAGITVNKAVFKSDSVSESITLLSQHPEGIVLHGTMASSGTHAVLLTDYTDGIFYNADPAEYAPAGRIPNSSALLQVTNAKAYWYVSSPSISGLTASATVDNTNTDINVNANTSSNTITNVNTCTDIGIAAADITNYIPVLSQTIFVYDGTEKKPAVTIPGLTQNVDYTLTYTNNMNPGTASVTITGMGAYTGSITKSFEIAEVPVADSLYDIRLALSKQSINKGKTATVKVMLPDSFELVKDYSGDPLKLNNEVKISYTSENKKIATVNSNGKITGKKKGTTNIHVTVELAVGAKETFTLLMKVK